MDVYDTCNNQGHFQQDESLCGTSSVDACSGTIGQLKPEVFTPANTLCEYNLECDTKFSMDLELNLSSVEHVSMRQMSNGVVTELFGNETTSRRMLSNGRQLSSTMMFNVTNADSLLIVYRNSEDYNSTNMIVTEEDEDSGDGSSFPLMMILLIILSFIALVATVVLLCWWRKKCKSIQNRRQQITDGQTSSKNSNQDEKRVSPALPDVYEPKDFHFHPEAPADENKPNHKNSDDKTDGLNNSGTQVLNEDLNCRKEIV